MGQLPGDARSHSIRCAGIFWFRQAMVACICITRPSIPMILTIKDIQVPVFHEHICRMNSSLELIPFFASPCHLHPWEQLWLMSWVLMAWRCIETRHHQQWHWPRCPGTCRCQRAVAPCMIRPSAPMILIMKNYHMLVFCEKTFNYNGLVILRIWRINRPL